MAYNLKLYRQVEKQLSRIGKKERQRLVDVMRSLREDPRPPGCRQLIDELFRIRVGQYRIIYAVYDEEVVVVVCKVARRTEKTYRDLEVLLERSLRELRK